MTTIHTDFLGSPVAETNASGAVDKVERFTPYGEAADLQLDAGPGFTGHATDVATGLTYMQQRYYDPEIGRFISPDPVGPEEDFINHFNRYNYAQNNPVRYTDPDGRRPGGCQSGECDKSTKQIKTENQQQAKMQETNNVATAASTTLGTISSAVKQGVGEFATADASTAIKGIANAGTAIDLVGSTAEVVIGINEGDTSAIAHGATTGTISVVPLPPNVKMATLIIDAIVQNVEYVQPNGETVNGWEAVGKHLSNVKYDCDKACW